MFCRFCGKQIEDDAAFCGNCGAAIKAEKGAEPFFSPATPTPAPVEGNRMEGFGKALTGAIFSFVSTVLFFVIVELMAGSEGYNYYYGYDVYYEENIIAAFILLFPAIALGVLSVVFGAKSIGTFKRAQGVKPIPTLICGIISLAEGALILLANVIVFFPVMVLLAEI